MYLSVGVRHQEHPEARRESTIENARKRREPMLGAHEYKVAADTYTQLMIISQETETSVPSSHLTAISSSGKEAGYLAASSDSLREPSSLNLPYKYGRSSQA